MPMPFKLEQTGPTALTVTRGFAAPPAKVWRAHTEPELVMKWMGMGPYEIIKAEIDLKVGGGFRYEWSMPEGGIMAVNGEYLDLQAPGRIVHTELFDDDWTDGKTTVTTSFDAVEAGTRMTLQVQYRSEEGLQMALQSGAGDGMQSTYEQLADLLVPA